MSEGLDTIRETPFGECIGTTIVDITATDTDEFLVGEPSLVYFHLSNGKTFFATMGTEKNPDLMGFIDMEGDDDGEALDSEGA